MDDQRRPRRPWHAVAPLAAALLLGALLAAGAGAAGSAAPVVGSWATYQWTSSLRQEVPVLIQQRGADGQVTWSVEKESTSPAPVFVTYAIVRADAKSYVLQIVTRATLEGTPLSITQVTVDRASGKALRSVIQRPKGLIATPESGLRPFRQAVVKGTPETVEVPAGRMPAVRAAYGAGTVWVSDQVPALGLVKATFPDGELELVQSGASDAKDLLRS
jgi:hypothetical protein